MIASNELTDKELEILKLFSIGKERDFIAAHFSISEKTLRHYLFLIYQKLGVKKLHQAIIWYIIKHYDLVPKKCGC